MSAPSPRPNAFLGIGNDLLGELRVAFSSLALDVVINNRFPGTWCFCQAYIPRNHALKDLCSEKAAQISRSEEHTSELQSPDHLVCRLLLEKKKKITIK